MLEVRSITPDEWPLWRAVRLAALGEAPYAFGSTLADWQGDGDREDRWRGRLTDVDHNLVALVDGRPVGQASGHRLEPGFSAELISMWVDPARRGRGVGEALVEAVAGWARDDGAEQLLLDVKLDNDRAIAFYERVGFVDAGINEDDPDERRMRRPLR